MPFKIGIVFLLFFVSVLGCGKRSPFKTEHIDGTITLDGVPLSGATIGFSPESPELKPAFAKSDAEGKFMVTSVEGGLHGRGAMIGTYGLSVSKKEKAAFLPPGELTKLKSSGIKEKNGIISLIPEKYADTETSGLTFEVVKGRNTLDIKLISGK